MARAKAALAPPPAANPLRSMRGTPYHAKYYATEITRMAPGGDKDRLAMSLFDACVDLNPHQIEAGLFALRSPLSKGVILADEVGLGKTIEAGLVLTQFWAERRRRLLIICPASIRKQWSFELATKFNLPNRVLDAVSYREIKKKGRNPFEGKNVVIVSYHFASKMKDELSKVFWDLVVLDEAHRLRNVHTKSAKMALNIKDALGDCRKLLLTATPLQNSLLELYGLASFVDERVFGDKRSFQARYRGDDAGISDLRARISPFVWRTLRKDVQQFIQFTARIPMTEKFDPATPEIELYEKVNEFIQRPDTYALPHRQKQLTGMVMRKILASSSEALVGTLTAIRSRLQAQLNKQEPAQPLADLIEDEVLDEEEAEELEAEEEEGPESLPVVLDDVKLKSEIAELTGFIDLAKSIRVDSKSNALLKGLQQGFAKMAELGAHRKALLFTESRRTQRYLKAFLEQNGYAGQVVLFNGTNNDAQQASVYKAWVEANVGTGRVSGSKNIDMRTALMEHFRDHATIMIATESAAEGVNLQFCSLVINYDLPWNPQRIEQRVGRCHRYGQKHDVVVINFLNQKNQADLRVFELLEQKFRLFEGVFGSSDEVLGAINSGVDFEKRVFDIYQQCRTTKEINTAFDKLRKELEEEIEDRMRKTRQLLIENFDQEVHHRVKINLPETQGQLDHVEQQFWLTTKVVLAGSADFDDANLTFNLTAPPDGFKAGLYRLIRKNQKDEPEAGDFLYRLSHPLGEYVLDAAKNAATGPAVVTFDLTGHPTKVTVLNEYKGKKGWLTVRKLVVSAFTDEEHIIFNGADEEGNALEPEVLEKLLMVGGADVKPKDTIPDEVRQELDANVDQQVSAKIAEVLEHNEAHFSEEQDRIERWAKDRIISAEKDLQDERERADQFANEARRAQNLQDRLALMKKQQAAEASLRTHQQKIWEAQDEIRRVRNGLIDELAARLKQKTSVDELFTIAWKVV